MTNIAVLNSSTLDVSLNVLLWPRNISRKLAIRKFQYVDFNRKVIVFIRQKQN